LKLIVRLQQGKCLQHAFQVLFGVGVRQEKDKPIGQVVLAPDCS